MTDRDSHTDVFDEYVEAGTVFVWTDTGEEVGVEGIELDEDGVCQVYVTDKRAGYQNQPITRTELIEKVESGELRQTDR